MNLVLAYNSDSHGMPLSNSVKVNNKTIQIRCKDFLSFFVMCNVQSVMSEIRKIG